MAAQAAQAAHKDTLRYDVAGWLMAALALWLTLRLHLLAGLLVYELVHFLAPRLYLGARRDNRRKLAAVALVTAIVVASFTALIFGAVAFLRSDAGRPNLGESPGKAGGPPHRVG